MSISEAMQSCRGQGLTTIPVEPNGIKPLVAFEEEIAAIVASITGNDPEDLQDNGGRHIDPDKEERPSQADLLMGIAADIQLFHDEINDGYAYFEVKGHMETYAIDSEKFRNWLRREYYLKTHKPPNTELLNQVVKQLIANAQYEGERHMLSLRTGKHDGAYYYDLTDPLWRAVKVTAGNVELIERPPILFRRFRDIPQVEPVKGEVGIKRLFEFININDPDDQLLLLVCLVSSFISDIPHPIIIIHGEKGSAKSTSMRILRKIVDPSVPELHILDNNKDELVLTLYKNYFPSFDNVDTLSSVQSDILCIASTGGGLTKRKLYTDSEEVILQFRRCIILNGINLVASKPDLMDRAIIFGLERIDPENRREESEIWKEFDNALPEILYGALETLSGAMAIHPGIKLKGLPRMADFCRWGFALAEVMGFGGDKFIRAYNKNIGKVNQEVLETNAVAFCIVNLLSDQEEWSGTASKLLNDLETIAAENRVNTRDNKIWPTSASVLSRRINQVKSNLMDVGITVEHFKDTDKARCKMIRLRSVNKENIPSDAVQQSEDCYNNVCGDEMRTVYENPTYTDEIPSDEVQLPDEFDNDYSDDLRTAYESRTCTDEMPSGSDVDENAYECCITDFSDGPDGPDGIFCILQEERQDNEKVRLLVKPF